MKINHLLFISAFLYGFGLSAQNFMQSAKLEPWIGTPTVRSVSVDGDYALIGTYPSFMYKRNANGGWDTLQSLITPEIGHPSGSGFSGTATALSGTTAMIGAGTPPNPFFTKEGIDTVVVFDLLPNGTWVEVQRLYPSDGPRRAFGNSISISGDYAIIGAPGDDTMAVGGVSMRDNGSAYIFERDSNGVWNEVQKIFKITAYDYPEFGQSVAIHGNTAIVGIWKGKLKRGFNDMGAAAIYERDSSGTWNEVAYISAPDQEEEDYFGISVGIYEGTAVIGAYNKRGGSSNLGPNGVLGGGVAYVFERNSFGDWVYFQKLASLDSDVNARFGFSVSIHKDRILIGAPRMEKGLTPTSPRFFGGGNAYIFEKTYIGRWEQTQKIIPYDRGVNDNFGYNVCLSEKHAIIGTFRPKAYIFTPSLISVRGKVYLDKNTDCTQQTTEIGIPNWIIQTNPLGARTMTDRQGHFKLDLGPGSYDFELIPVGDSVTHCQAKTYSLKVDSTSEDTSGFDYGVNFTPCHKMSINVMSGRRRFCSGSSTYLNYANLGLDTAYNVKAHIEYSPGIWPLFASVPFTISQGNLISFDLGKVPPLSSATITIRDSVTCNFDFFGLSPCVKSWITPTPNCNIKPAWCGDRLNIKLNCINLDVVEYTIINVGTCNMSDSSEFRIFLDSALVNVGKVLLAAGDSVVIQVITNAKTSRLEVDQVPLHPFSKFLVGTKEACGLSSGFVVSKGFVIPYPQSDPNDVTTDVDCSEIRNSFDPNDKLAQPAGFSAQHNIKPGTGLDYTIRFQNTGNDTAFQVVLIDTLSPHLDFSTFRQGVSSHPYTLNVSGVERPLLSFVFNPIALVDSGTNLPASEGFVKFSISPYDTLPLGTQIENFADIYFDFNPPVRTPPIFHTIWDTTYVDLKPWLVSVCDTPSIADAGTNIQTCTDTVTLDATIPLKGFGSWRVVSGNAVFSDSSSAKALVTGLSHGVTILEWKTELCQVVFTDQLTITRDSIPPTPQILMSQAAFCAGDSLLLVAPPGQTGYLWSNGQTTPTIHVKSGGNYSVAVTNVQGCTSAVSTPVIITQNPLPQKPSITGISSICNGDSTSLMVSAGFSAYIWSNGYVGNVQSVTNAGIYTVSVTDSNGCVSPISDPFNVTVPPLPQKPVITGISSICDGDSTSISAPTGFSTYTWSNGAVGPNQTVTNASTLTVFVADSNGCISPISDPFTVVVNPLPQQPIIAGITEICYGDSARLSTLSGFSIYTWSNGASGSGQIVTSADTFTVFVIDANGCVSPISDPFAVSVNSLPQKPLIAGTSEICDGDTAHFTTPAGFPNYTWSNGALGNTQNVTHAGTFSVSVTDTNGCVSPISDPFTVRVNPLPPKPVITGTSEICDGDSATFMASSGFASYTWSNGAMGSGQTVTNPGSFSVFLTDMNGCASPISDPFTVTVNPLPQKPVITGIGEICDGDSTTLMATPGFSSYTWSNGTTGNGLTVSSVGTFSVSVTDGNGCVSPFSDPFDVMVQPLPSTPVILQPVRDSLQSSVVGDTYQWFVNGVLVSQNGHGVQPTQSGTYTVIVTVNGCPSDPSAGYPFTVTGIDLGLNSSFVVYPNPTTGEFLLKISPTPGKSLTVQMYDLAGRLIFEKRTNFASGKATFEVSHLSDGMYLLKVDTVLAGKVLIQK